MMDKVSKKKTVSVNLCCDMFSLLDFFTLEDGADNLSRNVDKALPVHAS
jgi:hypothetical protein